ncbi:MAG: NAD-dependent epimerase [Deltaproteobacteria bacterium]|nr:MAG: NAD-dependent epimerase [Deltaproteobacteria bacterium]
MIEYKFPPGTRVLVTGASGFTGSVLVRKLIALDLDVVAIARPSSNLEQFRDLPIKWIIGDVFNEEVVKESVKGVSYVFHMAAAYREAKLSDEGYYRVHVLGTQLLARAALGEGSLKRFIHVSTVGVHGHIENPPADESYPFKPGDTYQKTKADAELWIRDFSEKQGLPLTVVRPCAIYGPGDKRLLKLFKLVSKGWVPSIGSGNHLYHLVHVDDLTDFLVLAAVHPKALGDVFICGSKEAITFRKMVSVIADFYNVKVRFVRIPILPLFVAGALCELICRPLGIDPPYLQETSCILYKGPFV